MNKDSIAIGDTALLLQVMAGYDPLDIASIKVQIPNYFSAMRRRTTELRLGVPRAYYDDLDSQILKAMDGAHDVLKRITAGLQDVELPPVPKTPLAFAEVYKYHAGLISEKRHLYQPLTIGRILQGKDMSATDYIGGRQQLKLVRNAIARTFETVDLLITPTVVRLPITIEEARKETGSGREAIRNTIPFNLYGIPSISIPCGFSKEGLPIGLQISGPSLGESDVLALAHAFEQATDWHKRTPPLK